MTRLRKAMMNFKTFWNARQVQNRSVILLLNKTDLFEEKILAGNSNFEQHFPEVARYRDTTRAQREDVTHQLMHKISHRKRKSHVARPHDDDLSLFKLFIRDCFLQLANYNQVRQRLLYYRLGYDNVLYGIDELPKAEIITNTNAQYI
jgi:50S ribosomal subunit-associated GTPase HflX